MDQRVIVVSEAPPLMESLDASAARTFLRKYKGYEMRVDNRQALVPMKRLFSPEDYETLVECTTDDLRRRGMRIAEARQEQRLPEQLPRNPADVNPEGEVNAIGAGGDAGDASVAAAAEVQGVMHEVFDSDDDELPEVILIKNSNEHVEEMLIEMFGPESQTEAIKLLKQIKMEKDSVFSNLALATNYKREWKLALHWCKKHTMKGKTLVKQFLFGVQPQKLATTLGYSEFEDIYELMDEFVKAYKHGVRAKRDLAGMGVLKEEATVTKKSGSDTSQKETNQATSSTKTTSNAATGARTRSSGGSSGTTSLARGAHAVRECWECKSKEHMRNECPIWKRKQNGVNQIGAIMHISPERKGPYLVVEVRSSDEVQFGSEVIRTQGFFDSGSDVDAIGENMVANFELIGGQLKELPKPMEVRWLDQDVTRQVTKCMELQVDILGTEAKMKLTFLVVPWNMDKMVVGWPTLKRYKLFESIVEWIQMQRDMNIMIGNSMHDENTCVRDMDGMQVSVDQYLFVDEEAPDPSISESILTPEEQRVIDELLQEYSDVFEEKPVGSANVRPMKIEMKPDWKPPPMGPPRRYAPKVQAAIDFDLQKLLDKGIVSPFPEATFACDAHAVPKVDSESGYRFCVDYRPVNAGAVTHPFPLPKIADILSSFQNKKYVGKWIYVGDTGNSL